MTDTRSRLFRPCRKVNKVTKGVNNNGLKKSKESECKQNVKPRFSHLETVVAFYGLNTSNLYRSLIPSKNKFARRRNMHKENKILEDKTSVHTYEILGKQYIVTSHFVGRKNINQVIHELAIKQAYADIEKTA